MARNICSICSAPAEIRAAIEIELSKPDGERKFLRDLQAETRFSKSALSRHSRNCMRRALLKRDREKWKAAANRRIVFFSPFDRLLYVATPGALSGSVIIPPSELTTQDAVIGLGWRKGEVRNQAVSKAQIMQGGTDPADSQPDPNQITAG
jgi:hypothetical protein